MTKGNKVSNENKGNEVLANAGGSLQSLYNDLKRFRSSEHLTSEVKKGLDIAVEQTQRYLNGKL